MYEEKSISQIRGLGTTMNLLIEGLHKIRDCIKGVLTEF